MVLDGALSLALPTSYGQSLIVEPIDTPQIKWTSIDDKGAVWFEDTFLIENIFTTSTSRNEIADRIIQILKAVKTLNPDFFNHEKGFKITTKLTFPRDWGLGTSSTLINNIAQWTQVNAFELLEKTFGGSGYDIACAQNNQPISYLLLDKKPVVDVVNFNPTFKARLYFVYLNKKQNSRDGIAQYRQNIPHELIINEICKISIKIMHSKSLSEFENLITLHETFISDIIKQKPIKEQLFSDFEGSIKSLGAWGGDFILVTSKDNPASYFKDKGFKVVIPYSEMILKN